MRVGKRVYVSNLGEQQAAGQLCGWRMGAAAVYGSPHQLCRPQGCVPGW